MLAAIEQFDDEILHALIARARALLLDRPASPNSSPPLAVEIVDSGERRLLAIYRALPSVVQHRLIEHATGILSTCLPDSIAASNLPHGGKTARDVGDAASVSMSVA